MAPSVKRNSGGEGTSDHPAGKPAQPVKKASGTTSKPTTPAQSGKNAVPKISTSAEASEEAAAKALHNAEQDSIEAALPILPRGFVENTAEIYAEVASFDVIPPEKLCEYWRVYTTTHRKLFDPTANRLENFWWHVWGSKRRDLSGKTVARLYESISTGPTFVPLRTPASRYDGPTINFLQPPPSIRNNTKEEVKSQQRLAGEKPVELSKEPITEVHEVHVSPVSATPPKRIDDREDSTTEGDENTDSDAFDHKQDQQDAHIKLLSSSSTRPAPAQSILRKPRPSFSGPRPTPRFALPSGEPSEAEAEEEEVEEVQSGGSTGANEDAAMSSIGSTDTARSEQREPKQAKRSSSGSSTSSKTASGRREGPRLVKGKATKKKFVVNSSASKRRTVVSKRSGSHGSQSSGASEGPGSREAPSYFPPRQSGESLVGVEEEELEDNILPPALASPQSPDPLPSRSRVLKQRQSPKLAAMSEKTAGKQPVRPQLSAEPERTSSPASEATAVSSVSGSVTGSVSGNTPAPAPVPASETRKRSSFAQYVTGVSGGGPGSLASSGGSSGGLEMPAAFRNRQSAQRPKIPGGPAAIPRPGGGLIRQTTMPYDLGQSHRQQLGRIGSAAVMSSNKGTPPHAMPPTSAYSGSSSGGAPGLPAAVPAAPMMGRSMSQDSYGARPRLIPGYQSPILGPMRSSTVTAPSMVAATGVFMDAEGPDTFELYAKTGLEEPPEEPDDGEDDIINSINNINSGSVSGSGGGSQAMYMPESGSFSSTFAPSSSFPIQATSSTSAFASVASSSYQDTQPAMPRPLFTPTRPTQTPRIPFARTRSQLNVILDREKERLGEGSYASWQESRGSRGDHDSNNDRHHRNS